MTHPKPDNAPTPTGPVLSAEQIAYLFDRNSVTCDNCGSQIMARGGTRGEHNGVSVSEGEGETLCGHCAGEEVGLLNAALGCYSDEQAKLRALLAQRDKRVEELQQRLLDMEARYHNDIQCRDALLETAKATIARQVEELDRVRELCDRDNQTSGRMIWTLGQDRDALRDGLEKLVQELPESEWFDTWIDEKDSPKIKLALSAAQALLSGAAPVEPDVLPRPNPHPLDGLYADPEFQRQYAEGMAESSLDAINRSVDVSQDSPIGTADDAIPSAMVGAIRERLDAKAHRPCNNALCQLVGMHVGQCDERADHPIHTRTEPRPIQVGDSAEESK